MGNDMVQVKGYWNKVLELVFKELDQEVIFPVECVFSFAFVFVISSF